MQRAQRQSARALAVAIGLLGVAIVVRTVVAGGGPLSLGVLLGAMLALLGAGRLVLAGGLRLWRRS